MHRVKSNRISKLRNAIIITIFSFVSVSGNTGNLIASKNMTNSSNDLNTDLINKIKEVVQATHRSPINQFKIQKIERKDWPNSALGCPKSGMQYMQVITPGYLVSVNADGIAHKVHTSENHAVVCGQSKPDSLSQRSNKKPKLEASTLNRIKAIQISRKSLIKTKEIEAKNVRLKSVSDALISDFDAQCKENYFGKDKGYKVVLSHEQLTVTFFSDGVEVVKCSSHTSL